MRKQFEELHPLFDLEKDEQGEYTCVLTRVTWLGFELGKKTLQAEIDQLNSVLDERTKEWLQAIECGTYFENVAKPLKTEINQLKTQLAVYKEDMQKDAERISELQKQVEAVSQVLCELKESLKDFQEMDLYDKGYRVTTEYVIADLEKALRGEHE